MTRATALAALTALLVVASRVEATITLELRVDAEVRTDVAVHVAVRNMGDEDAANAIPEATLGGVTVRGDGPATLPPAYVAAWDLTLPRPAALGTLPLVVQLHYADALGHRMSAPAVHVVRTAGTPPPDVAVTLEASPVTGDRGSGTVRIENRETVALTGTLALVTNVELGVTPAERTVDVAPGATLAVPVALSNRGALPGSAAALWASLTLARGATLETVIASAVVPVLVAESAAERPRIVPALAAAAALAFVAWRLRRALAPGVEPRSRADRRRTRPRRRT